MSDTQILLEAGEILLKRINSMSSLLVLQNNINTLLIVALLVITQFRKQNDRGN